MGIFKSDMWFLEDNLFSNGYQMALKFLNLLKKHKLYYIFFFYLKFLIYENNV